MKTPKYEDVLRDMTKRVQQRAAYEFGFHLSQIGGSPIEQVMTATLMAANWRSKFDVGEAPDTEGCLRLTEAGLLGVEERTPARFYFGWPRVYIACAIQGTLRLSDRTIRPDFAFVWFDDDFAFKVVVELDGHDFHERTPEQAQSDKSRDRELQALGWAVLRFTGREVLRSPEACLEEVVDLLTDRARAAFEAKHGYAP